MVYVLTQFMSPASIEHFRTVVAMMVTVLAFAFVAAVVIGG
jgi:hypothetical protein